jgi:hypothetical protein
MEPFQRQKKVIQLHEALGNIDYQGISSGLAEGEDSAAKNLKHW